MTEAPTALVLGLTNIALAVAIAADRWVHRVTGKKSIEARVLDLEVSDAAYRAAMKITLDTFATRADVQELCASVDELHEKASDFGSEQQKKVGEFAVRLASIDEHLRNTDLNVARLEARRRS
jgi:hypothetical protein